MQPVQASDPAAFATAINAFGFDVWEGLRTSGRTDNLALSPASVALALTIALAGARGETAREIGAALHVASEPEQTARIAGALVRGWQSAAGQTVELSMAQRLFAEQSFALQDAYVSLMQEAFSSPAERLDFRGQPENARETINGWVHEQTRGHFEEILPRGSVDASTALVLVNAVYFHGRWKEPFDRERTKDFRFFTSGDEIVSVPGMQKEGGLYGRHDGVSLLELRYGGDELGMLFVLPDERAGLPAVEARLDASLLAAWVEQLEPEPHAQVTLPRFRVETDAMPLAAILQALGIRRAFTVEADFGGIAEPKPEPLVLTEVFHRVFVEVNEEGTEAAAVTAGRGELAESVYVPPPRFYADHPFLFVLRDLRTGAVLFAGRIVDPS
jgi:serpin B